MNIVTLGQIPDHNLSEADFALAESKLGSYVHFHDGIWWIQKSPFYYKPVNEHRCFSAGIVTPNRFKALFGYAHRISSSSDATHSLRWNVIQRDRFEDFTLGHLRPEKRRTVKQGLKNCRVEILKDISPYLLPLTDIAESQANRHELLGKSKYILPADYYVRKSLEWQEKLLKVFQHPGHTFFGVFANDSIVAYADLISFNDTWIIGTVKSHQQYLHLRPVDALYFSILALASKSPKCAAVINGGGNEREGVTRFKQSFLFESHIYYYWSPFGVSRTARWLHKKMKM